MTSYANCSQLMVQWPPPMSFATEKAVVQKASVSSNLKKKTKAKPPKKLLTAQRSVDGPFPSPRPALKRTGRAKTAGRFFCSTLKNSPNWGVFDYNLVAGAGLEPATSWL